MSTLEQATLSLKQDVASGHLDKFIQELHTDLSDTTIDQTKLKQAAVADLVDKKIIPSLTLDGEKDGKLDFEDSKGKHFSLTTTADAPGVAKISDADGKTYQLNAQNELAEVKTTPAAPVGNTPNERYISRDEQGRVKTAGGDDYTYDASGKLNSVTWTGNDSKPRSFQVKDGKWVDEDGKAFASDPSINPKTGDLIYQKAPVDGKAQNIVNWRADSNTVTYEPDLRKPIKVEANGQTRDFKYDANKKLTEVDLEKTDTTPAESWKLENGQWKNYDADGKATTKPALKDITVDISGTYTETNGDGTKRIRLTDGSEDGDDKTERDVKVDGGTIHWKDGKIDSMTTRPDVTSHKSETRKFTYDENGALSRVDYDNNNGTKDSWRKENGEWVNYDANDKPVADKPHMKDIGINPNGDYYETGADDQRRTFHLNGTDTTAAAPPPETTTPNKPDTSSGGQDQAGDESNMTLHQKWVKHHHIQKAAIDSDIQAGDKHTVAFGDTMWDIAKSALKKNDGNDKPTVAQINAEIERLDKKNDIADPGKISIGKEMDTSPDKPANPTPNTDANAVTGDKGQVVHFDSADRGADNVSEIDYANGMKVTFIRNADKTIKEMDVTGSPNGEQDCKIVQDGDHYTRTRTDGSKATLMNIAVNSTNGEIQTLKVQIAQNDPINQDYNPDGTVTVEAGS